ncbi:hypothetical protein J4474_03285 [Candidatus Pacearchaeota archaeon]|nr:hypothetical protein [Candidatus Pacearchaeota archaeon]
MTNENREEVECLYFEEQDIKPDLRGDVKVLITQHPLEGLLVEEAPKSLTRVILMKDWSLVRVYNGFNMWRTKRLAEYTDERNSKLLRWYSGKELRREIASFLQYEDLEIAGRNKGRIIPTMNTSENPIPETDEKGLRYHDIKQ